MSSRTIILTVTASIMLTFLSTSVTSLPRLMTRQLTSSQGSYKLQNNNVCLNYMESCVPWETKCCNNMVCLNLARGYCLYPLENCMCQRAYSEIF
ncbi:hypothetical protein Btru_001094 [Bulinus truncatus]|nr:hypothetical protein Btru_001094 [Bulinus truncatus]